MKKTSLKISILLISIFIINNANAQRIKSIRAAGPVTEWNSGPIDSNKFTPQTPGNYKVWNNVKFVPGEYEVSVEVVDLRPNRQGTTGYSLNVKGLYRGNKKLRKDEKLNKQTKRLFIRQYNSKTDKSPVNYGKAKIKIEKTSVNTNMKFKISIRKVSSNTAGYDYKTITDGHRRKSVGFIWGYASPLENAHLYTLFNSKTNDVRIELRKLDGKAKTIFKIYKSSTLKGPKTFITSYEFANNAPKFTRANNIQKTINVRNVKGQFIHIEIDNQSVALKFKWKVAISEKYDN